MNMINEDEQDELESLEDDELRMVKTKPKKEKKRTTNN